MGNFYVNSEVQSCYNVYSIGLVARLDNFFLLTRSVSKPKDKSFCPKLEIRVFTSMILLVDDQNFLKIFHP